MPLPKHAITLHGGCNCGAIKYKIDVPAFEDRFLHPAKDQSNIPEDEKIRFPMSLVCHCNNCRSASGALINYAFACLMSYVSFTFEPRTSSLNDISPSRIPATDIFPPAEFKEKDNTYLSFYASSSNRNRSFCGRCGTNLTYNAHPMPAPWPKFLDIWAGTIDRADLEKDWLIPERHCWIDVEIPWVGKLACEGSGGAPRHVGGSDFK